MSLALLFFSYSGIDLDGSTIGIAFVGAMCGFSSVGVTQDGGRSLPSVGSTAAHELGHIFNMGHDGKTVRTFYHILPDTTLF